MGRSRKVRHDPLWEERVVYGPVMVRAACRRLGGDAALDFFGALRRMRRALRALDTLEGLVCEVEAVAEALAAIAEEHGDGVAEVGARAGREASAVARAVLRGEPEVLRKREGRLEAMLSRKMAREFMVTEGGDGAG